MKILVFSYWSIHEGISQATVFPLLEKINHDKNIEQVFLCTVENEGIRQEVCSNVKTIHIPLVTAGRSQIHKLLDLITFPFIIKKIVKRNAIDIIWCKGAPAGGMGTLVNMLGKTPFVVDSFEPHSAYMVHSGTWSKSSAKYFIQRSLERITKEQAALLLPVSRQYRQQLLKDGVKRENIFVLPCAVNYAQFSFAESARTKTRNNLSIKDHCLVGVYVGKFGGLYYDKEAFKLYCSLFNYFREDFFLIIITETDPAAVQVRLQEHEIPMDRVFVSKIEHSLISNYLSAADFAISTIKCVPPMRFCSPIKHGEYWAADLPILTTLRFGDDAEIIRKEGGGIIIDIFDPNPQEKFAKLQTVINLGRQGQNAKLALKYRNSSVMKDAIEFVMGRLVTKRAPGD